MPEPPAPSVEYHFRACREAAGLRLADLASPVGVHHAHLSRIERGLRDVKLSQVMDYARAIGRHPWDLLHFSGFPPPTHCPCVGPQEGPDATP